MAAPNSVEPMVDLPIPATPRAYKCQCGRQVFFRNSQCLACRTPLGYIASRGTLCALQPGIEKDTWQVQGPTRTGPSLYRRCANFASPAACNWLIEVCEGQPAPPLCEACRLNRTIPDLTRSENQALWSAMEKAKRRLVSQLIGLGLPVTSKVTEDPRHGLAYDLVRSVPGRPRIMTGHHKGIITINLEEADDAVRERVRNEMGEPYRTLLGHLRHEVGHYYWDRLVANSAWLDPCRELFGDDRLDYAKALKTNYEQGPPADWRSRFVSAYASMHPWEDWAETWAHYLHIRDTIDTAVSFGIQASCADTEAQTFGLCDLWDSDDANGKRFLELLHSWIGITGVMNEMSSAMGQQDFYPFALPRPAVAKLHFIHRLVSQVVPGGSAPPVALASRKSSSMTHRRRA